MKKIGWTITGIGTIIALGALLYPLDVIDKTQCIYLLLGGAGLMFVGSMFRAMSFLKR
ncbi:hypothetical protein QUF81_10690 [Peribacillus simplex]|uniref:Uncharacterized protein n=1 Tax=Peribacillus simplex TaxID=1478 RepID=A0AAW7IBX3_9BACI|nr:MULTISPECIES: hypothetical protein [Peribacillus]SNS65289.1 hypothetical protein SAMN05444672_101433 [Bacillus sp. OK838]MDF9760287.1 hypothetical protein [Peribacillus simplex]MDM5293645.1 hypothetical protein [Peribacillus simplex]MDM5452596.1 hypothetical protein [Peribacillus simplex]MDV7763449.1 hypothetical protein [Peribacillus sp. CSMR9]